MNTTNTTKRYYVNEPTYVCRNCGGKATYGKPHSCDAELLTLVANALLAERPMVPPNRVIRDGDTGRPSLWKHLKQWWTGAIVLASLSVFSGCAYYEKEHCTLCPSENAAGQPQGLTSPTPRAADDDENIIWGTFSESTSDQLLKKLPRMACLPASQVGRVGEPLLFAVSGATGVVKASADTPHIKNVDNIVTAVWAIPGPGFVTFTSGREIVTCPVLIRPSRP